MQFLDRIAAGGPWLLTAITPDHPPVAVLCRTHEQAGQFTAAMQAHGAGLYFNPAWSGDTQPSSGKLSKRDIQGSFWHWVELDPPADCPDLAAWREATVSRLHQFAPTLIVDSGRGLWAYWQRAQWTADQAEIEGVNMALRDAVGGTDHCHNVDRLARLPGTVNHKTGRTAAVLYDSGGPATWLPDPVSTQPAASGELTATGWTTEPVAGWEDIADDAELIRRMCNHASAAAAFGDSASATALWQGDVDALAKAFPPNSADQPYDASAADMSLANRLAYWTGGNCERARALMWQSGLAREKWTRRPDYLQQTILKAVSRSAPQARTIEAPTADGTEHSLTVPPGGKGKTTLEVAAMLHQWGVQLAFDEFKNQIVLLDEPGWYCPGPFPRQWKDSDTVHCMMWFQSQGAQPPKAAVEDGVLAAAEYWHQHPVRNYLHGLQWDGRPRLDRWLVDYFGVADGEYVRAVGAAFLIGAVARVMRPGCQMDTMLILEGEQGLRKSTGLEALFGQEWFADELPDMRDKDSALQLAGRWCIEMAELEALSRTEANVAKKFISRRVDVYRPPYGRTSVEQPRQCVFVGTTNDSEYLKDGTGNRRYWPVRVGTVHAEALKRDRDQIWAEAFSRYQSGEAWWLQDRQEQLARMEQAQREEHDPWMDRIAAYIADHGYTTANELATLCLGLGPDKVNAGVTRRIGTILRRLGWERQRVREVGWCYVRKQ